MTGKQYISTIKRLPARARSQRRRECGTGAGSGSGGVVAASPDYPDYFDVVVDEDDNLSLKLKSQFRGLWTEGFLSALGMGNSQGPEGVLALKEPLNSINNAGLASHPSASGQTIVWNGSAWAYGSAGGSVSSVAMTVPTGFSVSGSPVTSSGTLAISFASGYSLPLTADVTKGVTAYDWGDHSQAGYALASDVYTKTEADNRFLRIDFFRSLFRAYKKNGTTEVVPNDGNTSLISSIKAMFGFWTEDYLSALGIGPSGGGILSLKEPLNSINNAGLAAPTTATAGQALVYNGSEWKYSNAPGTKLSVGGNLSVGGTVTGTMFSGAGFKISGLSNGDNYVLLAGGGKVALSDIGGGSYLPLSGGTMTGTLTIGTSSLATQLTILRKHDSNGAFIEYSNNSGRLGLLGFSSNGLIARLGTDTTNLTVWHSGNFTPSDYVPTNSTRSIVVGGGNYNFYSPSSTALNLDSVYGRVSKYTSGGGIDADNKVDINTLTTPGVYAGNGSYYYIGDPSVALPSTTYFRLEVSVTRGTGSGTYLRQRLQYYNGYVIRERRSADGGATWTDFAIVQRDLTNYPSISNSETANYVFATPNGSAGVPSFRHIVPADIYTHSSTGDITNDNTEFFSSYQSDDGFNNTTHGNKIYRRPVSALWAYTKSKMTADTTLNVASATKLQTARTLWGQSFDGTADVSGSITGATSITATGLTTTKTLSISSESAVAHLIFSRGGNNYITAPSGGNISFVCGGKSVSNANRDMYISDGAVNITGTLNVSSNSTIGGTLGVTGVTTLGGALDVTGAATLSSTLAVTGDTTLGSTLYVNGTTVSQTIRAKTDKTYNLGSSSYYWKYLYVTRIYLASGVYLEYDSNNAGVKLVGAGLYTNSYLSANGAGSGSGSGSLNQPLSGINTSALSAPPTNGTALVYNSDSGKWNYTSSAGQRMYIDSGGLTIGNAGSLTVSGTANIIGTTTIEAGNLVVNGKAGISGAASSTYNLYVHGTGRFDYLVIGAANTVTSVSCTTIEGISSRGIYLKSGNSVVYANGSYNNQSDIRLKNIHTDAVCSVEEIADAPIFNFTWKGQEQPVMMLGTSANYWQRYLPSAVKKGPEGYLSMDYSAVALAAAVITARKVVDHEQRIRQLETENEELKKQIDELKAA